MVHRVKVETINHETARKLYTHPAPYVKAQETLRSFAHFSIYPFEHSRNSNLEIPYHLRRAMIKEFGFAVPCTETIEVLNKQPILEVGAGTGYFSRLLKDSIATDNKKEKYPFEHSQDVYEMNGDLAVRKYSDRDVFLSWAPYDSPFAFEVARAMRTSQKLFLIGENKGGCTADDSFFEYLDRKFKLIGHLPVPKWEGVYDEFTYYEKN